MLNIDIIKDFTSDILSNILFFIILLKLEPRLNNKPTITFSIINIVIMCLLDLYKDYMSYLFIILLFVFIYILNKRRISLKDLILHYSVSIIIVKLSAQLSLVILFIFNHIYNIPLNFKLSWDKLIICIMLQYTLSLIIFNIIKYLKNIFLRRLTILDKKANNIFIIAISLLLFVYILESFTLKILKIETILLFFSLFIFFAFFIFILAYIYIYLYIHTKEMKFKQLETNLQNMNVYVNELEYKYMESKRIRHDFKNILLSLSAISLQTKDKLMYKNINEALKMFNTTSKAVNSEHFLPLISSPDIKGIILNKVLNAKTQDIDIIIEVKHKIPEISDNSLMISRILGILLDNAVEASINAKSKVIRVAIISDEYSIDFVIENYFSSKEHIDFDKIFDNGYSTKGTNRGIGLFNVNELVKNNTNIFINTEIQKHSIFSITLSITTNDK